MPWISPNFPWLCRKILHDCLRYNNYGFRLFLVSFTAIMIYTSTLCLKKVYPLMFDNNFGKCEPIFKILSPPDSWENSLCIHKYFHLTCNMLLHYLVKIQKYYWFWQHPQQTVDMFLRTLWTLDLTFDNN